MTTFATTRKHLWTVSEIQALCNEAEGAFRAALIAEDILRRAMRHKDDPDVFYAKIADVYRRFDVSIGKPTLNIAQSVAVPHTTAARWVRVARQRGHLEEAK